MTLVTNPLPADGIPIATAERFLHSSTHPVSQLLYHQAQIRPVEMTDTISSTFEIPNPQGLATSYQSPVTSH